MIKIHNMLSGMLKHATIELTISTIDLLHWDIIIIVIVLTMLMPYFFCQSL